MPLDYHNIDRDESVSDIVVRNDLKFLIDVIDAIFRHEPRIIRAIGDRGSFSAIAVILGQTIVDGAPATLSSVDREIVKRGIATSRRSRALIEWLEHSGGVDRAQARSGAKGRPIRISGWLLSHVNELCDVVCRAARREKQLVDHRQERQSENSRFSTVIQRCYAFVLAGARMPAIVEHFTEHQGGFLILLRLVSEARRDDQGIATVDFSRKSFADIHSVSRAHVTALIARAERAGWLERLSGTRLVLEDQFDSICLSFFKNLLTIIRHIDDD